MFRLLRFAIKNYQYAVMGYSLFKAAKSKFNNKKHSWMKNPLLIIRTFNIFSEIVVIVFSATLSFYIQDYIKLL